MKLIRFGVVFALVCAIISLSSCGKSDSPSAAKPTVKFTTTSASYSEEKGVISIGVTLSAATTDDVTVSYSWAKSTTDTTAYLGGDFAFPSTDAEITITAGETTGSMQVSIIDDTQIDTDDVILISLVSVTTGNATVTTSASSKLYTLTIQNNDVAPTDALQVDLVWQSKSNKTANINGINLDLFLVTDVDAFASAGTNVLAASATSRFETMTIDGDIADGNYYLCIAYDQSTGDDSQFAMSLNGWTYSSIGTDPAILAYSPLPPTFFLSTNEFVKSGSSFVLSGRTNNPNRAIQLIPIVRKKNF